MECNWSVALNVNMPGNRFGGDVRALMSELVIRGVCFDMWESRIDNACRLRECGEIVFPLEVVEYVKMYSTYEPMVRGWRQAFNMIGRRLNDVQENCRQPTGDRQTGLEIAKLLYARG